MADESLPAIHVRLSFLENQMSSINGALHRLAEDMHQLAIASAKREQDAEALSRAFRYIEIIEKSIQEVKGSVEAADLKRLQDEVDQARAAENKEQDRRAAIIQEIMRTVLIVVASIALYHFGVKLL